MVTELVSSPFKPITYVKGRPTVGILSSLYNSKPNFALNSDKQWDRRQSISLSFAHSCFRWSTNGLATWVIH